MMDTTVKFARNLAVWEVDVLVAGGGPAGVAAAVAAARDGARTLLIEQMGCLGGMSTSGLIPAWAPAHDNDGNLLIRGLWLNVVKKMVAEMPHLPQGESQFGWLGIDAEILKRVYDDVLTDSGARVLYFTQLAAVDAAGGRTTTAVICNKAGLSAVRAKVFIDATGDGDLAARSGAVSEKGDPQSGELQGCTPTFVVRNVDTQRFFAWRDADSGQPWQPNFRRNLKEAIARAKANGDLAIVETECHIGRLSPTALNVNFSHLFDVDATDPAQLSDAMRDARSHIKHLFDFMRGYLPGFEKAELALSAPLLGVRETRRIVGDYRITADDYLTRRRFPDEIALNAFMMDVHLNADEWKLEAAGLMNQRNKYKPMGPGEFHGVPFRCLLPKGLSNVMVAGRCLSSDRACNGALRVMPMCMATGEAAGCAAAMMIAGNLDDARRLNEDQLRGRLRKHDAWLP